ncbi:hypothetical protein [Streptomyces sp. SA15]|uniref:hypothetical protein n=1 Tax=Streptomyces sp. SA15 TaxID=934019 RepID=UPI0015CB8CF0|nr:hypothetical protein [Streptomyces sp. SA15]
MTLAHFAPHLGDTADRQPGPNQWIKDHLDAVIDAQFLKDWPETPAGTMPRSENGPAR